MVECFWFCQTGQHQHHRQMGTLGGTGEHHQTTATTHSQSKTKPTHKMSPIPTANSILAHPKPRLNIL